MKKHLLAPCAAVLIAAAVLLAMFHLLAMGNPANASPALAAPMQASPVVTQIEPASAPNDLDTSIVISGTGFTAELSGTLVITAPAVTLGETPLANVTWVSSATLEALVPWGVDPGVYTLTVTNPGGEAASLAQAFTVTQGINTWTTGGPYGGWVGFLALGDEQGEIVYAIVGNVGLFRSRDGGDSWDLIFLEVGYENRVEVDPTNSDRLYIPKPGIARERAGLYRSEDGGDTWTAMPQPIPNTTTDLFLAFVNPHNGTLFGALYSGPAVYSCVSGCGLFKFAEATQTWIRLEEAGLLDEMTPVSAVTFDPHEPNTIFAGLIGGRVLKSTDGGETWSHHSQTPLDYIRELVVNKVSGELWVCGPGADEPGGLYRYDGNEWISMYTSPQLFTSVRNLVFDSDAANVQTQHIWIAAADGALKSEDGGLNWFMIGSEGGEAIALNPSHPQTIYGGNPSGVAKTSDGGASWQPVNEGITGVVPNFMAVNPLNPSIVYGCSVPVFGSQTGGNAWQKLDEGGCGPITVDPANPQHVVVSTHIADDGWNFNREFTIPMPPGMDENKYQRIINSMEARPGQWLMGVGYMDNAKPTFNYDGGGGIYLSTDGENWTWVEPLLECPPTGLGFDPVDENILYAATSGMRGGINCGDGTFLRSTDGGQTWQESTAGLPYYSGSGYGGGIMAVEPTPPYRIFLGNFVSSDQGVTWSDVANPLVVSYINQMLFLPGSPSILYTATGAGLFRSTDGAQTWQRAQGAMGQMGIWSLAGTTVGERQVLYVALVGGTVEGGGSLAQGLASGNEQLINAGVYRYTMLPLQRIYLPVTMRIYAP